MGAGEFRGASPDVLGGLLDVSDQIILKSQDLSHLTAFRFPQDLPADRPKTRLALEYLLGERAILEVCAAGWEEVENVIDTAYLR